MIYRRIIYISFIVLFLIAAPIVVLYTQGYRYNFQRNKIQKTGILIVSSNPKKAQIFLNGKPQTSDTPARLEKILPGDYEITLSKEGYHNWSKRLPIYENSTTFAEKIVLWKVATSTPLSVDVITSSAYSPDNQRIALITPNATLSIIGLEDNTVKASLSLADYKNVQILDWSINGKKIILRGQKNGHDLYIIADVETNWPLGVTQKSLQEEKIITPSEYSVKWDLKNDNYLYSINTVGIWQTDIYRQKHSLITTTTSTKDFLISGNSLYLFDGQTVYQQSLLSRQTPQKIATAKCGACRFLNRDGDHLILEDKENQKIIIVDPSGKKMPITAWAKNFSWLNPSMGLFYNDWEIWTYSTDKAEPELITRLGQPIIEAGWYPDGKHVFFATNDKIQVIELDNRELRNVTTLAESPNITGFSIEPKGKNLYFLTGTTTQTIYSLSIR